MSKTAQILDCPREVLALLFAAAGPDDRARWNCNQIQFGRDKQGCFAVATDKLIAALIRWGEGQPTDPILPFGIQLNALRSVRKIVAKWPAFRIHFNPAENTKIATLSSIGGNRTNIHAITLNTAEGRIPPVEEIVIGTLKADDRGPFAAPVVFGLPVCKKVIQIIRFVRRSSDSPEEQALPFRFTADGRVLLELAEKEGDGMRFRLTVLAMQLNANFAANFAT